MVGVQFGVAEGLNIFVKYCWEFDKYMFAAWDQGVSVSIILIFAM